MVLGQTQYNLDNNKTIMRNMLSGVKGLFGQSQEYVSFDAYDIRDEFYSVDVSEKGFEYLDLMSTFGCKKVYKIGSSVIKEEYIAFGRGYGRKGGEGNEYFIFINTDSTYNIYEWDYILSSSAEYNYYNAFASPSTYMTDEIWNSVENMFTGVVELSVTSSDNLLVLSLAGSSEKIYVDQISNNMRYGDNGLRTSDTSAEINTLQNNGRLTIGTYQLDIGGAELDTYNSVVESIKSKSNIVLTITVTTDSGTGITDIIGSNAYEGKLQYKSSDDSLRLKANYYATVTNSSVLSNITTNGWDVDGTYNYVSIDPEVQTWETTWKTVKSEGIAGATVVHNENDQTISLINGEWSLVMQDRNIGATSCDVTETASYGNYYSDPTTATAPTGFHVARLDDYNKLYAFLYVVQSVTGSNYVQLFKLPKAGYSGGHRDYGYYWVTDKQSGFKIYFQISETSMTGHSAYGSTASATMTIRCFKD